MPICRARQITLTAAERHKLNRLAYSHTAGYQQVIRARIVRDAARGYSNAKIAEHHQVTIDTVRRWHGRWADEGMAALADRRRPGRSPASPRSRWPRSRHSPANYPPRLG